MVSYISIFDVVLNVLAYVYAMVFNRVWFLNMVLHVAIGKGLSKSLFVVLISVVSEAELYVGLTTVFNLCST